MRLFGPSRLGNVLIVTGLLLLLYIPASYGWTELQGALLQAQLRGELPPPAARAALEPSPSPSPAASATGIASAGATGRGGAAAAVAPSATPMHAATATATRSSQAAAPSGSSGPGLVLRNPFAPDTATAAPSPTPQPTAVPTATPEPTSAPTATPEPTETPSPTPVPPGPPVRLVFPDLRIDTAVTEMGWTTPKPGSGLVSEWEVPENTAGWAVNSAPLGVPSNVVIAAHNNIYGMVFRNISLAWPQTGKPTSDPRVYTSSILNGRIIELYAANGQRFDYEVTNFYRLQDYGLPLSQVEKNADYMQPTPDAELTLITCWPPWSNTYRLMVRAKLVQP